MSIQRAFVTVMLGAGAAMGCGTVEKCPDCPAPNEVPLCPLSGPIPRFCRPSDCNSPVANGFPINGLTRTGGGECNPQNTQLMPGSLSGGKCGRGADLTLSEDARNAGTPAPLGRAWLVGKRDGQIVCRGAELKGATFQVRSSGQDIVVFTIADVQQLKGTSDGQQVKRTDEEGAFEGYMITAGSKAVCDPIVANAVQQVLGVPPLEEEASTAPGYQPLPDDHMVIAVPGPLYDLTDSTIANTGEGWFNLACVRDALAKRSLYGLYKENDSRNETALKAITARYCNKRAFTLRGAKIGIEGIGNEGFASPGLEARWKDGRAVCLRSPRLLMLKSPNGGLVPPGQLPQVVQPEGCERPATCDAKAWLAALQAECNLRDCNNSDPPPFDFESTVDMAGLRVLSQ